MNRSQKPNKQAKFLANNPKKWVPAQAKDRVAKVAMFSQRVVRRTRSLIFMAAELVVGTRVVATANGVWKTLGKRS